MSLFDSKTKILFFSENDYELISNILPVEELISVYFVRYGEDNQLQAKDKNSKIHTFNAPANGAVVLVSNGGANDELLESVISLWERASIEKPNIINIENADELALCKKIYSSLINDLHAELLNTTKQAVDLDKQIAALREELENLRLEREGTKFARGLAGERPTLSFERLPNNIYWDLGNNPYGTQLLPYSGSILSAVAINVQDINTLKSGKLLASLKAREDNRFLEQWEIDDTFVIQNNWLLLKISDRISYKYRYIDLVIEWHGNTKAAPQLGLANAYGDDEAYANIDNYNNQNVMLALKVWSGILFDNNKISQYMNYGSESFGSHLTVKVPQKTINSIQKAVKRNFDHRWLTTDNNNLLLHPTLEGPSIACMNESWSAPVRGISALLSISNHRSPDIAFSIITSKKELSEKVLDELANEKKTLDQVNVLPWKKVLPGSEAPVEIMFTSPASDFKCYFLTKVDGKTVDNAHSWFKDIKYIL